MSAEEQILNDLRCKSDGIFHCCFSKAANTCKLNIAFHATKAVVFTSATIMVVIAADQSPSVMALCMIMNTVASALNLIFCITCMKKIYTSTEVYITVAREIDHIVLDQTINHPSPSIEDCFSQRVFVTENNIAQEDLDQGTKSVLEAVTRNSMLFAIRNRYKPFKGGQISCSIISFISIVISIVALSTQDMSTVIKILLIAYVVIVGLSEIVMVVGFLILCLIPIILIGLCVCMCCHRRKKHGEFIDLAPKKATRNDIVQAKGDCPICFQAFDVDERVYVLPCSSMHVFHCQCLEKWSAVSNTCPVCRHPMPMTDHKRQQLDE